MTSTVENYLKCIRLEQERRPSTRVTTGRIASAMQVAPGTVTAMIKTLTDAGLVDYEPYAGVRLTEAGGRLATHVLRRHRLIELFLVRFMGMDWSEVHADAEELEHAVSDRLLERMDEMLGHPSVDPHGDPIPDAGGEFDEPECTSMLKCGTGIALNIVRVTDQRAEFLRLLERHSLMPGRRARVESRDEMAETVTIVPEGGPALQLGFDAASRILVEAS